MQEVEARLRERYPGVQAIAWEGDASTFQFTYVSAVAEALLGYPVRRWLQEPAFWAEHVVSASDRSDAVGYCALATASKRDHVFEYRAQRADGTTVVLRDVVRVVLGPRGVPERLRGLMFDVTARHDDSMSREQLTSQQNPSRHELESEGKP